MSKTNEFDVRYDRRVSEIFLQHFVEGGLLASLPAYAKSGLFPLDLRFRKEVKTSAEHATLYVGLTSVLDVRHTKAGKLRLTAHKTHRENGRFDPAWATSMSVDELAAVWPDVELYLDRIIPIAALSHGSKEGAVQAAVSSFRTSERVVLDREVTPAFKDENLKKTFMAECQAPILAALNKKDLGFGKVPAKLGNECDALAVDANGRVLAVEVKPLGVGSIAWVVAQATMYARILQRWLDADAPEGHRPVEVVTGMLEQRQAVALAPQIELPDTLGAKAVPVVAVQRGASPEMIRRMCAVRDVLAGLELGVAPVEIYEVSLVGELIPLDESRLPDGRPAPLDYARAANERAVAWKRSPDTDLPAEARGRGRVRGWGGTYDVDYALPAAYSSYNLLSEVRDVTLELFKKHKITWHQSVDGGPTNHLRSSQVQCVNALGQMMSDPERIARAFGGVLDIASVRDLGTIDAAEKGRFLTFEFVGLHDYFGEGKGGVLSRGSQSTSVDAAFAYVDSGGRDALALVEWKFTETYPMADPGAARKEATRLNRYTNALQREDGPVDISGVNLPDLFHEPIYQLVRQQLLARELERDPRVPAELVTVVHVLSPDNAAYQRSYISPALRGRGATTSEVWKSLLRTPRSFVTLDPAVFLDPKVTSNEYVRRYGGVDA